MVDECAQGTHKRISEQLVFDFVASHTQQPAPTLPWLDHSFPEDFANQLATAEAYNKHLYRPNTYLHKWWARRCGTTFRLILKQLVADEARQDFYSPGGLEGRIVLNPMMGGGTTLHEAIRLGAKVIGVDIDPIPVLQARAALTHTPLPRLESAFEQFFSNAASEDQQSPAVTTNQQHRYLVVWQYAYPGPCCDWDIRGQELDVSGNLVGSELIIASTSDDELYPDVVARPGPFRDYLAIWQRTTSAGEAIYASRWGEPGVTPYYFEVASAAFWSNKAPAVATDSPAYLVVYEGDSTGDPTVYQHIYGRMWWPEAVYLPLILRNKL